MTVAVAVTDGEKVWMGADGRSTHDSDKVCYSPHKLWSHLDGRMGMATAGAGRLGEELRHEWEPPAFDGTGDAAAYVRLVAHSIEDHLHAEDRLWAIVADSDDDRHLYGAILIGIAGRVFWVGGDFCTTESEPGFGFASIGSGGPFAEGSLHTTQALALDPQQRVRLALEAAAHEVADIGPPFIYLDV